MKPTLPGTRRDFLKAAAAAAAGWSSIHAAFAECRETNDLTSLSATQLANRIARRQVSCVEVIEAYLERISAVNPKINAIVQLRAKDALKDARRADKDLARGRVRGPLHGVPFTLKDNIETAGMTTTCGMPELAQYVPKEDATVAKRLKRAGGILLGKTNVPEFCMYADNTNLIYGRTKNPHDLSRFTGGSSGGEGAIIAACGSAFGIGTDIGSSIREPAHYCGIAGLKPTSGRVPETGVLNCFPPFNANWNATGPMARYVQDLALVIRVIHGPDGRDPDVVDMPLRKMAVRPDGLRVAYFVDDGFSHPATGIQNAVRECAERLTDMGATVTEARPPHFVDAAELWVFGMVPELGSSMRQWLNEFAKLAGTKVAEEHLSHTDDLLKVLDFWAKEGRYDEQHRFRIGRRLYRFRSELQAFMQNFDVLLCPVMNGPAEPFAEPKDKKPRPLEQEFAALQSSGYSYTMAFNITGWPAASVPIAQTAEGLPLGVQVVAKAWREDLVLGVAQVLERAFGGWKPPRGI